MLLGSLWVWSSCLFVVCVSNKPLNIRQAKVIWSRGYTVQSLLVRMNKGKRKQERRLKGCIWGFLSVCTVVRCVSIHAECERGQMVIWLMGHWLPGSLLQVEPLKVKTHIDQRHFYVLMLGSIKAISLKKPRFKGELRTAKGCCKAWRRPPKTPLAVLNSP